MSFSTDSVQDFKVVEDKLWVDCETFVHSVVAFKPTVYTTPVKICFFNCVFIWQLAPIAPVEQCLYYVLWIVAPLCYKSKHLISRHLDHRYLFFL